MGTVRRGKAECERLQNRSGVHQVMMAERQRSRARQVTGFPLMVRITSPSRSPVASARSPGTQPSTRHAPACCSELLSVMPAPSPSPTMQTVVCSVSTNDFGVFRNRDATGATRETRRDARLTVQREVWCDAKVRTARVRTWSTHILRCRHPRSLDVPAMFPPWDAQGRSARLQAAAATPRELRRRPAQLPPSQQPAPLTPHRALGRRRRTAANRRSVIVCNRLY